jgi:hypothetical protein
LETQANVSLAILIAVARMFPRTIGPKKCGKVGVGEIIRELRAELPGNSVGPYAGARREAMQILESQCRACSRCEVGRRPMMETV